MSTRPDAHDAPRLPDAALARLWRTLDRLLAPDGCPWDREQRLPDLARHLIDEGHEWLEACEQDDPAGTVAELGDLAYLLLFGLQRLARDRGQAAAEAALDGIDAKLRRRHPQLFPAADGALAAPVADSAAQLRVWEQVKRAERDAEGAPPGLLKPLPRSLGALARSHRYQEKAAGVGFDWDGPAGVLEKLDEELAELRRELAALPADVPAGTASPSARYRGQLDPAGLVRASDELGDVLFVLANLARWLGLDAEAVAEQANAKFLRRFAAMEAGLAAAGTSLEDADLARMEAEWQRVKGRERGD